MVRTRLARTVAAAAVILAVGTVTMMAASTPAAAATSAELAARRAPIHYQDTDSTDYDADYLSRVGRRLQSHVHR